MVGWLSGYILLAHALIVSAQLHWSTEIFPQGSESTCGFFAAAGWDPHVPHDCAQAELQETQRDGSIRCTDPVEFIGSFFPAGRRVHCAVAVRVRQTGSRSVPIYSRNAHTHPSDEVAVLLHDWIPPLPVQIRADTLSMPRELAGAAERLGAESAGAADAPSVLASLDRTMRRALLLRNRPIIDALRCKRGRPGQVRAQRLYSFPRTTLRSVGPRLQATCYAKEARRVEHQAKAGSGLAVFFEENQLAPDEFPCFIYEDESNTACTAYIWQNEFESTNSLSHAASPSIDATTVAGVPFDHAAYLSARSALISHVANSQRHIPLLPLYDHGIWVAGRMFAATAYHYSRQYLGMEAAEVHHRVQCVPEPKLSVGVGEFVRELCDVILRCPLGRVPESVYVVSVDSAKQILANGSHVEVANFTNAQLFRSFAQVFEEYFPICPAGKAVCHLALDFNNGPFMWHPDAVGWAATSLEVGIECAVEHALATSPMPAILREKGRWLDALSPFTGDLGSGNRAKFLSYFYEVMIDSAVRTYCEVRFCMRATYRYLFLYMCRMPSGCTTIPCDRCELVQRLRTVWPFDLHAAGLVASF